MKQNETPSVIGDPRYQAFAILAAAFLTQWLGKSEFQGPLLNVITILIGVVAAPLYMIYGIWMARLRKQWQEATQQALVQAAKAPESVDSVIVRDPTTSRGVVIRLHDIEKPKS